MMSRISDCVSDATFTLYSKDDLIITNQIKAECCVVMNYMIIKCFLFLYT